MSLSPFSQRQHYAKEGQDIQVMFVTLDTVLSPPKECHLSNTFNSAAVKMCRNQSV